MGYGIPEESRAFWLRAYQDHGPSILAYLTSRVGRRELAEDFLQETFVRVIRQMTVGSESANLRSYLFTTAHNLVVSHRRRTRPALFSELADSDGSSPPEPPTSGAHSAEEALDLSRLKDRLNASLGNLSPAHRTAFTLAVLEQTPYADIAKQQGWTIDQVKVNVHRARKKVIASLRDVVRPSEEIRQ